MKKYLKLQAKKSMSLFLSVLMILSCWVWVAPDEAKKAEAGNISAEKYKVEINFTISTADFTGGNIKYKTSGNGWGTQSDAQIYINSFDAEGCIKQGSYTKSFTTTDFPSYISVTGDAGCGSKARMDINWIKINNKQVWTGDPSGFTGANTSEIYPNNDAGDTGNWEGTYEWPKPMIAGFTEASAKDKTNPINLTLNNVGGQNVSGATSFDLSKYTFYDQYGKQIADADKATFINNNRYSGEITTTTHVAGTENSEDATENTDIWLDPNNADGVVVSPNLQVSDPKGSVGKATYYLVKTYKVKDIWDGEQTSKVSAAINVTYPKYTVNFDAGLSSAKITADTVYTGTYSPSNYNGGTITVPSKTEAEGYTFYEYWSKPQPTSGDASYNALTANFAKPCSTDDYNSYKATGTVNGDIVTDTDGNKWYDAGMKLDPTTAKTIDVSENYANFTETWYGWWLAKDLTVKFYDVDGTFLGEKAVKSGQTQNAITWPVSDYIYSGYTSGAFKFTVDANIWETTDGTEINKNSYTFTKDLILTPKLTRESFTDEYAVNFINPDNGSYVATGTSGSYDYRANIKSYADTALGKIADTPADVDGALDYSYELLGWSSVEPTTGKNYHVLLEDADFDVNGTAIGLNSDWVVRNEATYYAVYRRHTKTYVVNFNYKDATGADATRQLKVKYGATLVPPTDYVPYTYVTKGFGYTFDKWAYTTDDGDATLDYAATIPFTSENISIAGAALEGSADLEPIEIHATYGAPVATPYTVTFNYVDDEGEDVTKDVEVKNEQFILQTTVDTLKPAEEWDHDDNLYTYANKWEITEGAATIGVGGAERTVGAIVDTAELITLTPTSNVTFKAVYANPVPFYTVTYIDGAKTFSDRVLQGSNVPEWTYKATNDNGTPDDDSDDFEEDKIYAPEDYEGDGGTYVFQGWYDEKQTDETFKTTNGNKITTADKVTKNLTLYPQFKFVPDTFEIKFMSYDGKVQLSAGRFEKGQNIEAVTTVATKAAQGRPSDDTYTYLFLGWDKPVPTFCEGHDVTFIAQYKPVYKYYNAKWYNSKLEDGKWVADKTIAEEVETNLLATTHHTYNSKLYTPAVDNLTCLETAPEGQNYVFAGWYYNVGDEAVKYERGMLITADMEFYATYTLTAKVYTVTTVVKGEETKYSVASGETAEIIPNPQAGYVDTDKHDAFVGWYTDAACTAVFDVATEITKDTTIYAKFEESDHEFNNKALKTAPTYYAKGVNEVWCSCNQEKTSKTEDIPMLTDNKIPTGTIYLGDKSWSSDGEAANLTDGDPISIFVNANTDVIITSNDTGDVNALYNPSGIGKGVKVIRAFAFPAETVLTADNYGAAQQLAIDVYNNNTEDLTNNANFAVKLGDFIVADLAEDGEVQYDDEGKIKYKPLESGKSYIIYYYVTDKADNQLNRKVRTAKFLYDNTDPVFTVEGNSNNAAVPTYCGEATVTGIEKDVVLTVNGAVVEATYAEGVETGTYKINYAEGVDNVFITATDKAGNTYSKKIKVADHAYLLEEVASTCTTDGYKKETCIICGHVKTDETYEAIDHVMGQPELTPADCVNNGYTVTKCENCDYEVKTEFEEDGTTPLFPAYGHEFAEDASGNIIYETVTASTCKTAGVGEAVCTACNGELEDGVVTTELALNPDNHEEELYVAHLDATCVDDGYHYEYYPCCNKVVKEKEPITATGHGEKAWEVVTEANCYQPGTEREYCTVCTATITEATAYGYTDTSEGDYTYVTEIKNEGTEEEIEVKVTEEIDGKTYYKYYRLPATGEHIKYVKEYVESIPGTQGYVLYGCKTEGCPWTDTKELDEVKTYTVKFLAEDGKTEIAKFEGKYAGEYIAKTDVPAPAKAETNKYKYSFAGWVEVVTAEDGKVSDGATYKLPLEVTKDITLKATYKETKKLYTHKFVVPNTWVETTATDDNTDLFATLVGAVGDERVPASIPVFKHKDATEDARLKNLYTFEFKGWKNAKDELVDDFSVSGDAVFTAVFEAKSRKYDVVYYNGSEVVWTTTVAAGNAAEYKNYVLDEDGKPTLDEDGNTTLIIPEKDYDDENHYTFAKWYTDADLENEYTGAAITEKTRLYAGFTGTKHSYSVNTEVGTAVDEAAPEVKDGIIQKADCVLPELTEYICSCGHTKTEETNKALGHEMSEYVYNDETGMMVSTCKRGCGETDSYEASYTVKFVHDNGVTIKSYTVKAEDSVKFEGEKPTKATDAQNTYEFDKWVGEDNATYAFDHVFENVTANAIYKASYKGTVRKYNVSYLNADKKAIETYEVAYGDKVPAFTGTNPTKAYDDSYHYTFTGWSVAAGTVVKSAINITPVYKAVEHDYVEGKLTQPTCTEDGGLTMVCTVCGHSYVSKDRIPATGHDWDYTKAEITKQPDDINGIDGEQVIPCKNCDEKKTEPIKAKTLTINIKVVDTAGTPLVGATVILYDGNKIEVLSKTTDANGAVSFTVPEAGAPYTYSVVYDGKTVVENQGATDGNNTTPGIQTKPDCPCSCHRDNFWGILFRLIQKFIKLFTGKIGCCSCPDPRY